MVDNSTGKVGDDEDPFKGFKFSGRASLNDDNNFANIAILRDTGSAQSILVCSSLLNIEKAYTGQRVLLKDLSGYPNLPLAKVCLENELASGPVSVGVVDGPLPVKEVQFLLGNDLAGTLVVPNPVVVESPIPETNTDTERLPP